MPNQSLRQLTNFHQELVLEFGNLAHTKWNQLMFIGYLIATRVILVKQIISKRRV